MSKEKRRLVVLKDETGPIFPQTHLQAVIDSNNRPLNQILEDIQAGNANLTDIRAAIAELQEQIFPLTASLQPEKSIYEYIGTSIPTKFVNSIKFKNSEIDRAEINEFSLSVSDGISNLGDYSTKPKEISFYLLDIAGFDGYKSYSARLNISLKNGRTAGTSCSFYQISPVYIGWSNYSESTGWIDRTTLQEMVKSGDMKKVLNSNISGTYEWEKVTALKSFWIIVPNSNKFSGFEKVLGNSFPATMKDMGQKKIGTVEYRCFRNYSGPIASDSKWTMQLS